MSNSRECVIFGVESDYSVSSFSPDVVADFECSFDSVDLSLDRVSLVGEGVEESADIVVGTVFLEGQFWF